MSSQESSKNVEDAFSKAGQNTQDAANKVGQGAEKAGQNTRDAAEKAGQNAREAADKAGQKTQDAANKAGQKVEEGKQTILQRLRDDGVVNPKGLLMAGAGPLFLAAIPAVSWIASPHGVLEKAVNGVAHGVAFFASAGSTTAIAQTGKISALSALYIAVTYALSGAGSAAGVDAGNEGGRDNNYPRKQVTGLEGLPLRLYSAHYNLLEMFGGFALSAALAQALAPADQHIINLLGLHVISKVFLYYPAYLLNIGPARTLSHVIATSSVIGVALKLSRKPLL